jgi:predicted RNA-binding protein YlxR (DUF448 family)
MMLYHGSYLEIKIPDLNYSRYNLDFGKGFYITGLVNQAEKWAQRRTAMAKLINNLDAKPVVSVYEIDFDSSNLKLLSFDGYTEEWLDFIVRNRGQKKPTVSSEYDIIFGNVANDDVAAVVDDYMRLLEKERIDREGKLFFIKQLQFSKPNDQYCIVTKKAEEALKFIRSYELED